MQIIKESEKRTLTPTPSVAIHEYDTHDAFVSGATAEIKGRYPETGFVVNRKIKELAFVLSGSGAILTPQGETPLAAGDLLFIDHGEVYAWQGDLHLFMATAPTFDPAQYEEVGG